MSERDLLERRMGDLENVETEHRAAIRDGLATLSDRIDIVQRSVEGLTRQVRESMRPKLASLTSEVSDADERLSSAEDLLDKLRVERSKRHAAETQARRDRRRLLLAVALGATGALGAGVAGAVLDRCGLPAARVHHVEVPS